MDALEENSIDAIVCDPPYGLQFMGAKWDHAVPGLDYWERARRVLKPGGHLLAFGGTRLYHRLACAIEDSGFEIRDCLMWLYGGGLPKSHNLKGEYEGLGTALKPAWEPIILARKPFKGTVVNNVVEHGTGAINIDGCRVGKTKGRWPANVVHDGSDEIINEFPNSKGQMGDLKGHKTARTSPNGIYGPMGPASDRLRRKDTGTAARFFYAARASKKERGEGNTHPTVKPLQLMRWLCRLVTPPNSLVLDPFCGSGSTVIAAIQEGFHIIGIDVEPKYTTIAKNRVKEFLNET